MARTPGSAVDLADLPAPKRARSLGPLPSPLQPSAGQRGGLPQALDSELPAPRASRPSGLIPASPLDGDERPAGTAASGGIDLPAPKRPSQRLLASDPVHDVVDLPAPRAERSLAGVPASRRSPSRTSTEPPAAPRTALPVSTDLPATGGPKPTASTGLPATRGPMLADLPAPRPWRGAFRPTDADLPGPPGLFHDLPQPAQRDLALPTPKDLVDDLPQAKARPASEPEVPAPQGFFDDLPGRRIKRTNELRGLLDEPERPARPIRPAPADVAETAPPVSDVAPELAPTSPPAAAGALDDLELSDPGMAVPFDPASGTAPARPSVALTQAAFTGPALELEEAPTRSMVKPVAPRPPDPSPVSDDDTTVERPPNPRPATHTHTLTAPRPRAPLRLFLLGGLLVVVLAAGGGFVLYQRHLAAVAREAEIADQLLAARKAYDEQHWQRAAAAAGRVVDLDRSNPEALGIGAEALLASALDDGLAAESKIAEAQAMLAAASRGGIARPEIARARALAELAAHRPDAALGRLQPLADQAPGDPALALYLGWALLARGDAGAARKAFDRAAGAEAVRLRALYGRGGARLALGDLEGAHADFTAVLERAKDHLGAMVGLAASQPASAGQRREADLLAILARKDIARASPRVVALAWTLAGDAAMRAGRHDLARERFHRALAERPQDLAAATGLAETELRDGKVSAAAELTARALGMAKDYVPAQLVQSEIEIKQRRLPLATQRLTALAGREIPLLPLEQARLQLVTGKLLDAERKEDEAADAYVAGARAAGELDLEPMLVAVGKLAQMAKAAIAEGDWTRAGALRGRADELLGGFADHARRDPQLALTLGVGYLQAGDAVKAEPWLRSATKDLPDNAEAWFQLGRALLRSERRPAALEALNTAFTLDPTSADIGADLAHAYEVLGRDPDADALYTRLLALPEPSLELRARSGRFFARTGARDKADEQGKEILAIDPHHPAGLYLEGERLLASGQPLEAEPQLQRAVDIDRDPQYLDALGRAAEALAKAGERDAYELALRAYQEAAEAAPEMLHPRVGQGRLLVDHHEAARAVPPLLSAARIDPGSAEVMLLLGAAYQELQQPAAALPWLEGATRIAPIAEAYWRIGQIERDANHGRRAMAALASATRLASESEAQGGKRVAWLTDALYLEGRVGFDLHDEAAARRAWTQYRDRNPPDSAQLTEVKQLLATSLQRHTGTH